MTSLHPPLRLGPLIMGGAGFSYQLTPTPTSIPAVDILSRAFALGLRAIDTSPYYDPSELILGEALAHPRITSAYAREDYVLMTKVGRLTSTRFDYSAAAVRASVQRSLVRFNTHYLDAVYCHDVEFVPRAAALAAVAALFDLAARGAVRHVGISGYDVGAITALAADVVATLGRPLDVVQVWAQLCLQNTALERGAFDALRDAGVRAVCCSSPLAVGLLRKGGVPTGSLGDWHPAPPGLRERAARAAEHVEGRGWNLAALALRFAMRRAAKCSSGEMTVSTITGVGSLADLEENVATARAVVGSGSLSEFDGGVELLPAGEEEERLYEATREILGEWVDYDLSGKTEDSSTLSWRPVR